MMSSALAIIQYDRPDLRAESAALSVMTDAFDPAFGEAWNAAQLSAFMPLHGVMLSLARLDGGTLGFTLTRQVLDETELMLLAVSRAWQGKGVGKLLVDKCMSTARSNGSRTLHLEVRANNDAVSFYEKLGFEQGHIRPAYYRGSDGSLHDAISYTMSL